MLISNSCIPFLDFFFYNAVYLEYLISHHPKNTLNIAVACIIQLFCYRYYIFAAPFFILQLYPVRTYCAFTQIKNPSDFFQKPMRFAYANLGFDIWADSCFIPLMKALQQQLIFTGFPQPVNRRLELLLLFLSPSCRNSKHSRRLYSLRLFEKQYKHCIRQYKQA